MSDKQRFILEMVRDARAAWAEVHYIKNNYPQPTEEQQKSISYFAGKASAFMLSAHTAATLLFGRALKADSGYNF